MLKRWKRANALINCLNGSSRGYLHCPFVKADGNHGMSFADFMAAGIFHRPAASLVLDGLRCEDLP